MFRDELPVHCWCEEEIVFVRSTDIMRGKTKSCGRRNCTELLMQVPDRD